MTAEQNETMNTASEVTPPPPPEKPPTSAVPAPSAPEPRPGFPQSVTETLLAAGVQPEAIAAAEAGLTRRSVSRSAKKKGENPRLLAQYAPEMLAEKPGRPLWAAGAYGRWLESHGHHVPMKGNQAWGDAGGITGLDLVVIIIGGRKFYDLRTASGMSPEQKDERQRELNALPMTALLLLIVDVGD